MRCGPASTPTAPDIRTGLWKHCLWGGIALWLLTAIVTYATKNTTLLPTLILLGSFLIPAVFVLWAYERHGSGLGVGLIEEAVKLLALMYVLRRQPGIHGLRAGIVLGASVGFGFAAFESAGYAFNAAVTMEGIDLRALLETEILRGALAPFGHGLWTAIAGAVLLAYRRPDGRFRFAGPVVATYLGVALLHALWDSMHGIALWLVAMLTTSDLQRSLFAQGYIPEPTSAQQHLFTLFSVGGLVVISLMAITWARSLAHRDPSWKRTP
ncbi:PrsW family intramembrane metalloprotease [Streptomyces apocyni]|uniref:PrsW family intramembrane metalloprotease n=1 Tax=Streptomyces apocyni TaxID=2654677 RepID=UPI0012E99992|nr:PrsW family intramembrane metalloprotease [Streptomyces apocyni]